MTNAECCLRLRIIAGPVPSAVKGGLSTGQCNGGWRSALPPARQFPLRFSPCRLQDNCGRRAPCDGGLRPCWRKDAHRRGDGHFTFFPTFRCLRVSHITGELRRPPSRRTVVTSSELIPAAIAVVAVNTGSRSTVWWKASLQFPVGGLANSPCTAAKTWRCPCGGRSSCQATRSMYGTWNAC